MTFQRQTHVEMNQSESHFQKGLGMGDLMQPRRLDVYNVE